MRVLLGVIIGIALTLGAAYLHDTTVAAPAAVAPSARGTIVNWDVLGALVREQTAFVRGLWDRTVGG